MSALAAQLLAQAARLNAAVVEELYRNRFWQDRFGERGRKHAEQDGLHHLRYLAEALTSGQPAVLAEYARWLQGVLTTRGMCSRHLDENFARLAGAISREGLDPEGQAGDYLRQAREALVYRAEPARELQLAAEALAGRAAAALDERHPDWEARWGAAGRARCADDLHYHLAYLADSLALANPATFAGYLGWMDGFLGRLGLPPAHLREALAALEEALGALSPGAAAAARATLAAGRAGLEVRG